ncbi:MAG: IS630 family transposase [Myxococcota bacterium]
MSRRSATGKAIRGSRRTKEAIGRLRGFTKGYQAKGDLKAWRRGKAVLDYIEGKSVIAIAEFLGVARGSVNRWLQAYDRSGLEGLRVKKPPGAAPRLSSAQKRKLTRMVEDGPEAHRFNTGIWTGPMIGELIRREFDVSYHNHHIPRLLHQLGFSVQRPRKRLARADHAAQEYWLRTRLPAIKEKPPAAEA